MNVLIVGYGRMGQEVEKVLKKRGHNITGRVDPFAGNGVYTQLQNDILEKSDMVIEFALAEGIMDNAKRYASSGTNAVIGTTGWEDKYDEVKQIIDKNNIGYLFGSNFSIGANLFFRLVQSAAGLVNKLPEYDIMLHETHHKNKKDSPSGTALKIADLILEKVPHKKRIQTEKLDRKIEEDELHVSSLRGGDVPGTHSMLLDSSADSIEIKHTARNRSGFALGAVLAGEWLMEKKGFFSVDDFLRDILQ